MMADGSSLSQSHSSFTGENFQVGVCENSGSINVALKMEWLSSESVGNKSTGVIKMSRTMLSPRQESLKSEYVISIHGALLDIQPHKYGTTPGAHAEVGDSWTRLEL